MNTSLKDNFAYILDDHTLFADALGKTLQEYCIFKGVLTFNKERDLIKHLLFNSSNHSPYLFLDYYLEEKILPSILLEIKRIVKESKIIVLTGMNNPMLLKDLLSYQPDGIAHKTDTIEEIIKCITEVNIRNVYHTPYITNIIETYSFKKNKIPFSPREVELINCFSEGLNINETAEKLNLSHHTIASHRKKMFKKVNCNNLAELLAFARKIELI